MGKEMQKKLEEEIFLQEVEASLINLMLALKDSINFRQVPVNVRINLNAMKKLRVGQLLQI
jgi:hypothetical protein